MGKAENKRIHNKPGAPPISTEEREKILEIALERMIMIEGNVFGLEDDAEPEAALLHGAGC